MDEIDRIVLDRLQLGLPLAPDPWQALAAETGLAGPIWRERVQRHLDDGLLTRFGPMFDIERLGGAFTLAALSVPAADFEAVAERLHAMPEVAHNYERAHHFNMWFVLACETPQGMAAAIARIERDTGLPVLDLPRLRTFHIGLYLPLGVGKPAPGAARATQGDGANPQPLAPTAAAQARALIALTQAGLPPVPDPWHWLGERLALTPEAALALVRRLQDSGVIRRIAAVPNHYRLGWHHNGMTVWDVADEHIAALGQAVGALPFVSHCYQRPRRPGWPYNLFAMVHGRAQHEIDAQREQIRELLGAALRMHEMLVSRRILKKTGLRLAGAQRAQAPQPTPEGVQAC